MKSPPLQSLLLANTLAATGVLGVEYPDCKNGPLANNTVCDASASPPDRAAALVRAMNITEKLSNLVEYVQDRKHLISLVHTHTHTHTHTYTHY